jgi:cytochrome c oxidase subunit 2
MIKELLSLPVLASEHGKDVDNFIIYIHWLMVVLFIGWTGYYLYALWRFRSTKNKKADYIGLRGHSTTALEVAVAAVEVVLLIGFAIPLWAKVVDTMPTEETTQIRVMAQQFGWNFLHPGQDAKFGAQNFEFVSEENKLGRDLEDEHGKDDIQTMNEIHLPVDTPVVFHISSLDVIHSFKVIALRVCQDAIPGLSIPTWCTPTQAGRYQINCAQLCGNGHSAMIGGFLSVDSAEDYASWLEENTPADGDSGVLSFE